MKIYKYIVIALFSSLLLYACSDDGQGEEYVGNIIIHGDITNLVLEETNNDSKALFQAFSGGSSNDFSSLNGEDWTYELWVKVDIDTAIGDRTKTSGEEAGGACISVRVNNFEMYLINDDNADFAIQYNSLDTSNQPEATMTSNESSVNLSFNQWFHVAISRSASDGIAKFYINGILIDSSSDPIWKQLSDNDKRLNFNCMDRNATKINFFKGGMNNIRVSKIDRYPTEFTPNYNLNYGQEVDSQGEGVFETDSEGRKVAVVNVDEHTMFQLNLNNIMTEFSSSSSNYPDYKKIKILGYYTYYIKLHNNFFSWDKNIEDEYPVTGH